MKIDTKNFIHPASQPAWALGTREKISKSYPRTIAGPHCARQESQLNETDIKVSKLPTGTKIKYWLNNLRGARTFIISIRKQQCRLRFIPCKSQCLQTQHWDSGQLLLLPSGSHTAFLPCLHPHLEMAASLPSRYALPTGEHSKETVFRWRGRKRGRTRPESKVCRK